MTQSAILQKCFARECGFRILLSCEHGGNRVPPDYANLFAGRRARQALASHRGSDPGALALARSLSRALDTRLLAVTVTRLLVEVNRSRTHPKLFSEFSRSLNIEERERVLDRYYRPHRDRVLDAIQSSNGLVCHIGVHSFAPKLQGETRQADIGLLYDPARRHEAEFCRAWQCVLRHIDPLLRVRRNYPYRGTSDGLTTALRKCFPEEKYVGLELEVNQALLTGDPATRKRVSRTIAVSLSELLYIDS